MAAPAFSCLQNMHRLKQRLALESFSPSGTSNGDKKTRRGVTHVPFLPAARLCRRRHPPLRDGRGRRCLGCALGPWRRAAQARIVPEAPDGTRARASDSSPWTWVERARYLSTTRRRRQRPPPSQGGPVSWRPAFAETVTPCSSTGDDDRRFAGRRRRGKGQGTRVRLPAAEG